MWDEWQSVFRTVLGQTDRTYVSELRDVRNRWAHQDTFSTDDAERALDTMRRLLRLSPLRRPRLSWTRCARNFAGSSSPSRRGRPSGSRPWPRSRASQPVASSPGGNSSLLIRTWRQAATSKPSLPLTSTRCGEMRRADEYGKPVEFFRRTFLTDGLRELLLNAVRRSAERGRRPDCRTADQLRWRQDPLADRALPPGRRLLPAELPGVEAIWRRPVWKLRHRLARRSWSAR